MPRPRNQSSQRRNRSARRRPNARNSRRRGRPVRQSGYRVHRRLVLFPQTPESKWLSSLKWFGSIALKLFTLLLGVDDDLTAESKNVGSGTVMILGPADFASVSPFAVPTENEKSDKELTTLRAFPFERTMLKSLTVKICPSADLGSRGGMYAALLMPIDDVDSALISATEILVKYSADYNDIIKHPRAKLAPVTRPLSLSIHPKQVAHNIRAKWDSKTGFYNMYPTCVLLMAFSDLAAIEAESDRQYIPTKCLFEVHLTGNIDFLDPSDLEVKHKSQNTSSMSNYTEKVLNSNSSNINKAAPPPTYTCKVGPYCFETLSEKFDLRQLPLEIAEHILVVSLRSDLLTKLRAESTYGLNLDSMVLDPALAIPNH